MADITCSASSANRELLRGTALLDPENYNLMYNLGCSMIRLGETDEELKLLGADFEVAQTQSLEWWKVDTDLDPIRNDPRFKAMLEQAEAPLAPSQ